MNLASLAWRYLWARPLNAGLNLALLSLGVAVMTFLLLVDSQIERALMRDLAAIDLVVGAKGSPMQLVLAGVFHLDAPTGNIPGATLAQLRGHAMVSAALPLALGDSVRGFRIVGTEGTFLDWYGAGLSEGRRWSAPMEVVLGHSVAHELTLAVGAAVIGSHGLGSEGQAHEASPYVVVGRLQRCNCVLDRLVLTAVESIWAVHEHGPAIGAAPQGNAAADGGVEPHDLTIVLVRYRTPLAAAMLPRWVQTQPALQAASPALETARLLRLVGVGLDVMRGFAMLLLAVSTLSVLVALVHAVRDREGDLAMMRMLGAAPARLAALVTLESLWLALLALCVGLLLGHGLTEALGHVLASQRSFAITGLAWTNDELWCIVAVAVLAVLAAAIPAWRARQLEVTRLLQAPR
ncbi:MAG TPA: FtsX-like permease family protein [Burkholderiaceae bacterium]